MSNDLKTFFFLNTIQIKTENKHDEEGGSGMVKYELFLVCIHEV